MFKQIFKRNIYYIPYVGIIVIIGILYWIWGHPFIQKKSALENEFEKKIERLESFHASPEEIPSPKIIGAMEKENEKLEEFYSEVKKKLRVKEDYPLPKGRDLSLYYMEKLGGMKRKFKNIREKTGFQIQVQGLGLVERLPAMEDAPGLIKRMHMVDTIVDVLVRLGVESGVRSIENITIGAKTAKGLYEEIPVNMRVICDTRSFTKLLFALENTKEEFLIIRGFDLISEQRTREIVEWMPADRREIPAHEWGMWEMWDPGWDPRRREIQREIVVEDTIKVDLILSIIRWKKL